MNSLTRFQLFCVCVLSTLVATNCGCDLGTYSARAEEGAKNFKAVKVKQPAPKAESPKADEPSAAVGQWELNNDATVAKTKSDVNPIIIGGPTAKTSLLESLRTAKSEFDLKADGTFTCQEVMDSKKASYRGKWSLQGNQISINQTHRDGKPEKDLAEGTLSGNKMDLVIKKGSVRLPFILKRM